MYNVKGYLYLLTCSCDKIFIQKDPIFVAAEFVCSFILFFNKIVVWMKEKISSHVTWDLSRLQNQPTRLNSLKKCEAYGPIKGHKRIISGISGSLKTLAKLFKSISRIEKISRLK